MSDAADLGELEPIYSAQRWAAAAALRLKHQTQRYAVYATFGQAPASLIRSLKQAQRCNSRAHKLHREQDAVAAMDAQYAGSGFTNVEVEGARFNILLGTDPEDVKRWREQRRARPPLRRS